MQYFLYAHAALSVIAIIFALFCKAKIKGLLVASIFLYLSFWILKTSLLLYFVFGLICCIAFQINLSVSGAFQTKSKIIHDIMDVVGAFLIAVVCAFFWCQIILSSTFFQLKNEKV